MNNLFDFVSCYTPKSESDAVFDMMFDNLTTGVALEVLRDSLNIFRVYLTIMFIPLKQI